MPNVTLQAIMLTFLIAFAYTIESPSALTIGSIVFVACNFLFALAMYIKN